MIMFKNMWKSIGMCRKCKRKIKEVNFESINLREYMIIDVRSRREFRETHLNGAINIPLQEIRKDISRYVNNKDKKLLICCQSGIRSEKAVEILEDMGYIEVYNLKGGIENI